MSQQPPPAQPWGVRLRWHREHERQETREEFAEAVNKLARGLGENVGCGERLVARWEDGEIRSPRPVYRRVLAALGAPLPTAIPATWRRDALPPSVVDEDEREEDDPVRRRAFVGAVAGVTVGALVDGIEQWLPRRAHALAP
jgi:hypothetical protein